MTPYEIQNLILQGDVIRWTAIMAFATIASFIALTVNAVLFQKQLKVQKEQKDVMLKEVDSVIKQTDAMVLQVQTMIDLRRKQIAPELNIYNDRRQIGYTDLIQSLFIDNKGEMAKWVFIETLKDEGLLIPPVYSSNPYKFFANSTNSTNRIELQYRLKADVHDIKIGITYADMDGNIYDTIVGFIQGQIKLIVYQSVTLRTQ